MRDGSSSPRVTNARGVYFYTCFNRECRVLYKLEQAAEVYKSRGPIAALKFASKLNCLGDSRDAIQKASSAQSNPGFYRELGYDPDQLVTDGIAALLKLIE